MRIDVLRKDISVSGANNVSFPKINNEDEINFDIKSDFNVKNNINNNALNDSIDENTSTLIVAELENQLTELEQNFETTKKSNGWISKRWDLFKNKTGIGAGSNKTQKQIDELKEKIEIAKKDSTKLPDIYQEIFGEDLTLDNINALFNKEEGKTIFNSTEAGNAVNNYSKGQEMVVDVTADMVSGFVAIAAAAAAPFTGGASLALAGAVGAGLTVSIKARPKSNQGFRSFILGAAGLEPATSRV